MKTFFITLLLLIIAIPVALYLINPYGIYQLTATTARFIPQQAVPKGLVSLKAADCGACHVDIYLEWRESLHAKAYRDPFFQAYHRKDKGDHTCLTCHTPLQNQSPVRLVSKDQDFANLQVVENPQFDAAMQQEGVTCAACHVRDGVIYGPYAAADMNAPHPVAFDRRFLSQALCNDCHEVPSKSFSLMNEGICSTGMEFAGGHWAEQGYICQDCHMPRVSRPLAPGFPARQGRRHTWPGGYSATQLAQVFNFDARRDGHSLHITITNSGAGHRAPTGDPDRYITLEFFWLDEQENRTVLDTVEFKRRIIWQPIMFVLSDNRLGPGESLTLTTRLVNDPGTLHVDGSYHVMTDRQLKKLRDHHGLSDHWPIHRPFLDGLLIPVKPVVQATRN